MARSYRFVEVKVADDEWHVIDMKDTPRVVCTCYGFKGPLNAEYICNALEHYHTDLYETFLGRKPE
jgi:hypothetical protein